MTEPTTGPAALAELVEDERKFRTYVVLSLQGQKAEFEAHRIEDRNQFANLKEDISDLRDNYGNISSSVGGLKDAGNEDKGRKEGSNATLMKVAGVTAFLLTTAIAIYAALK